MVYFLVHAGTNSVKIGYTRGEIGARLAQIIPCSPVPLELVAVIEGDANLEAALHAEFDSLRLHNEWFSLEGPLRALVRCIITDGAAAVPADLVARHRIAGSRHGTVSAYVGRRCRCAACSEAARTYGRRRRAGAPMIWQPGKRGRPPKAIFGTKT